MLNTDSVTLSLVLAQSSPPPPGAGAVPAPPGSSESMPAADGATGAPGSPNGQPGAKRPPDPLGGMFFPILLVLLVAMIAFTMFGQRRDRKKRQAMISAVKKHDRVQTIGGVIGSIVEVKPDTVVLKVDESSNTRITFARSAIQQVLSDGTDAPAPASLAQ